MTQGEREWLAELMHEHGVYAVLDAIEVILQRDNDVSFKTFCKEQAIAMSIAVIRKKGKDDADKG